MNNTKSNLWLFRKKNKDITFSYEIKQKLKFIKGSILAIICGLIIGGIIIAAQNVNPFIYLKQLFHIGFNGLFVNQTIQWLCIYIIAALAVGIGFKSGMFNIGVSGQMVMGAGIAIIFFKLAVKTDVNMNAGYIIAMFLICAFSGAIMAGIAGALKALFNIHEVVTTIMLNWTAWYLMKYIFTKFSTTLGGHGIASSASVPGNSLTINGSTIAIPIIIAAIAVIVIAILLSKTVFGFKLKSVGASPDASKYAGYSVKRKMVDAMLISGCLAGIASFVNIFTITPNITFATDNLPQIGYDSIAITLVAFNNPIGTVFSSFLWAVLQSGGSSTASLFNLPTQMSQLIFGVIVYFAAISVLFINWYPVLKLRIMIALSGSKANQIKIKNLRKQQAEYRKELMNLNKVQDIQDYKKFVTEQISKQKAKLANAKSKEEKANIKKAISDYKNDMNIYVKEYRKNLKEMINKITLQIKAIKKDNYVEKINSAKEGINRREWEAVRNIEQDALSKTALLKSNTLSAKDTYNKDLKKKNNWLKDQLKDLKKEYKLKLTQNAVCFESETGIKNHYWEMRNTRIEVKALINKNKIDTHNSILNIKSDHQMARLDLRAKLGENSEAFKKQEKVLVEKMNKQIAKVKADSKQYIAEQKDRVKKLTDIYKTTKSANEKEQRQILADKNAVAVKKQEISEILDVWDNNLATLVDIKLAYQLKNAQVDQWYAQQKANIYKANEKLVKKQDWNESNKAYEKVEAALESFKSTVKALGHDNSLKMIATKKKALDKFEAKVKSVWTDEYSDVDDAHWSKKRFNIYTFIDAERAKLEKIEIVIKANDEIKDIETKSKYIKKMYNENIKVFKTQYNIDKRVDVVKAQQNYSMKIEQFISNLEKQQLKSTGVAVREVK